MITSNFESVLHARTDPYESWQSSMGFQLVWNNLYLVDMLLHDDYMMMYAFFILKRNGEVITKTKAEVFILSYSVPSLSRLTLSCSDGGEGVVRHHLLRFLPIT